MILNKEKILFLIAAVLCIYGIITSATQSHTTLEIPELPPVGSSHALPEITIAKPSFISEDFASLWGEDTSETVRNPFLKPQDIRRFRETMIPLAFPPAPPVMHLTPTLSETPDPQFTKPLFYEKLPEPTEAPTPPAPSEEGGQKPADKNSGVCSVKSYHLALSCFLQEQEKRKETETEEVREFDIIYIKNSDAKLIGTITKETDSQIFIKLRDFNPNIETPIDKAIIAKIEPRTTPKDAFLAKRAQIKQEDYLALFGLARWCLRYPELIEDAKKTLREAVKAKPNFLKGYLFLSDLMREEYEKTGLPTITQLDSEIALYRRAIAGGADSPRIRLRLGLCYKQLGLLPKAETELNEALKQNETASLPDVTREAKLAKADILINTRKYADATTLLEELITTDTSNFRALLLLGKAYLKQCDFAKAAEILQKALAIDPLFPQTYTKLAAISFSQGDFSATQALLDTAEKFSVQDVALLTDIAIVCIRQGKFITAETKLKEALSKDPNYARAHFVLGYLAENKGDLKTATTEYEIAKKSGFYDGTVSFALATTYYLSGTKEKTKEELHNALSLGFYPQEVFKLLARISYEEEDFPAAVRFLKYPLSSTPDDADAHYLLALTYLKMNNKEQAEIELAEALKVAPSHSGALNGLAYISYNNGNYQRALALFNSAKSANPEDAYASKGLEKVDTVLNQVFWEDNFARPDSDDISNGWIEENDARAGIEIKIESNRALFAGTQKKANETVAISRAEIPETFIKFEVEMNAIQASGARVGISILERSTKDQKVLNGIILFKDEGGILSYNFTEQREQWKTASETLPFPSDTKSHVLAIKLVDKNTGLFKLFLDDIEIGSVTSPLLARAKEFTLSIFGQAGANVPWTLIINRVRISRVKTDSHERGE